MKASVLFGAGWENDSVEVLWRDSGRAFCNCGGMTLRAKSTRSFPTLPALASDSGQH